VGWAGPKDPRKVARTFTAQELDPGTWEIVAITPFAPAVTSSYRLRVRFDGLQAQPAVLTEMEIAAPGTPPKAEVTVTPAFDTPFVGTGQGSIDQYRRERTIEMKATDTWSYPFEVDDTVARVRFELELPAADWNGMTDVPVNILDGKGAFVANAGLNQRKESVELAAPAPGRYTLVVSGAMVEGDDQGSWSFRLVERFVRKQPLPLRVTLRDKARLELFPDAPATLAVEAEGPPPQPPDGFQNAGELQLIDDQRNRVRLTIPVHLQP
jgi:hypothetical protein